MVTGTSKYPSFAAVGVTICVVSFLIITEHESPEFFDNISKKKKYLSGSNIA